MHTQFVLASHNSGKIEEFKAMMPKFTPIPLSHFTSEAAPEPAATFVENALLKARFATQYAHLPALADDSGLVIPDLGGAPGVISARFAGPKATDSDNITKLLSLIKEHKLQSPKAFFYCCLVWIKDSIDPTPKIFEGAWQGTITTSPSGRKGFGYDPIFFVPTHQCTAADLTSAVKNQLSHRAIATRLFLEWTRTTAFP